MTPEEVEAEFWAYHYADRAGEGEEFEDDDFDLEEIMSDLEGGGEWEDVISDYSNPR
jgi:hypothetical protein